MNLDLMKKILLDNKTIERWFFKCYNKLEVIFMDMKLEGIIISEVPYGDNSKIINILTKEKGIVGVMCNGAKSIKNALRAKTMKFTYGYFYITYNENKLSKLNDVDIIDNLTKIKGNITLNSYMLYITELTYQVAKQNNDPEIYNIFINIVKKMNDELDPGVLTNILELKYLDFLGIGLNLDSCIKCGNKKNIVTLDPDEGGFICQNCYHGEKIYDSKVIQLIRMYYLVDINSISSIKIKKEYANDIDQFLDRYYDRYTGLYIKSKNFLKNIVKL